MALTKAELDLIYVYYGRDPSQRTTTTGFYWQKKMDTSWSEFPLQLRTSTMIVKHTSCTIAIYYAFGDQSGELPTSNGPIMQPTEQRISFALGTSPSLDPDIDDEATIGIITINPHGRDWFLVNLPPDARGKGWRLDKGGHGLKLEDFDAKTVKRIQALQKDFSNLEKVKGKGKMK